MGVSQCSQQFLFKLSVHSRVPDIMLVC
uniref:Uncharacterized protein n=1 Tax=Anguilla anguilla TaxID=7936 RepID=A0A0E9URT2_ANGAN